MLGRIDLHMRHKAIGIFEAIRILERLAAQRAKSKQAMTRGGLDRSILTALARLAIALLILLGIWRLIALEMVVRRALVVLEGGCQ